MKIYLIRHSESIDDIEDCYGGIADFDLSENGKNKVKNYQEKINSYGIEKMYTSPYKRANQTAQILNENIKVEMKVVDDIRELNQYGIMSGVNKERAKEIFSYVLKKEEYKNFGYYLGTTFLGGEDIKEFDNRVKKAISFILEDSKGLDCIAIITHGGVYRSIFKNVLGIDKKVVGLEDLATTMLDYTNGKLTVLDTIGIELEK